MWSRQCLCLVPPRDTPNAASWHTTRVTAGDSRGNEFEMALPTLGEVAFLTLINVRQAEDYAYVTLQALANIETSLNDFSPTR